MNDSDNEFIAEEEITQAAGAQDTSLTTPISQKRKKKTKKKHYRSGPKSKSFQARRVPPRARNTTQSK